jgi:integrase/recombinase XerD
MNGSDERFMHGSFGAGWVLKAYLEPEEVAHLEESAICIRDRLLIRLLFRLGCRVSEALSLTVEDIDFIQGTVIIEHLKSRIGLSCHSCGASLGKSYSFCPRCGTDVENIVAKKKELRRVRTLPVDDDTLEMLRDYINRGRTISKQGKTLVFGINRHRAWQIVRECGHRAGLGDLVNPETGRKKGISPHRLRDAFAVHAMKVDDSGDGLRLLQVHLGHASFNTTAKYRKIAAVEHREWYQRLWNKTA